MNGSLPDLYPPIETWADEREGEGEGVMFFEVTNSFFLFKVEFLQLVGHSMCTLAAILVNETMAL